MNFKWEIDQDTDVELQRGVWGGEKVLINNREVASRKNTWGTKKDLTFNFLDGRAGSIKVSGTAYNMPEAHLTVNGESVAPFVKNATYECTACKTKNRSYDKFCSSCGEPLARPEVQIKHSKIQKAQQMMLVVAALYFIAGVFLFFMNLSNMDKSMAMLESYKPEDIYPTAISGVKYTVKDLRTKIQFEKYGVLVINVFLGFLMLGLYYWGKKSPLIALIVAAAIYVAVIVLSGILDPVTLGQGWIIKMMVIFGFFKGIKSSLELKTSNA